MVPHKRAFDFNQGIMDFGALVCTARRPKCDACPMAGMCRTYPFDPTPRGRDRALMARRERIVVTAAVVERDGAFLLTRRLDGTHLAGHWEFPGGKLHAGETLEECLVREIREELDAAIERRPGDPRDRPRLPRPLDRTALLQVRARVRTEADAGPGDAVGGASRPAVDPAAAGRRRTGAAAHRGLTNGRLNDRRAQPAVPATTATAVPGSTKSRCT